MWDSQGRGQREKEEKHCECKIRGCFTDVYPWE